MKPVPATAAFQRVINTSALILQGGPGEQLLPACLRRLADAPLHRGSVDADPACCRPAWTTMAKELAQDRRGRPARRRAGCQPEAIAANGVPTVYVSQVPTRADRLQRPARLRADHRHATAVGGQHDLGRLRQHRQQRLLRADGRALVQRPGLSGPWTLRRRQRPAGRLRTHPAGLAGRGGAAHRGRHAAGAGGGDRELDPADGHRPALNGPTRSRPASTGRRSIAPIAGHAAELRGQCLGAADPGRCRRATSRCRPGVWFTAPGVTGPWTCRRRRCRTRSTPSRRRSPMLLRRPTCASTRPRPQLVYVGYTPGYLAPWCRPTAPWSTAPAMPTRRGSARSGIAPPYTYGMAAAPVYNPYVGFTYGFAWAGHRRAGWGPTGAAPTTTPATGAAMAAAPRPAPTCTATGATPRTRARAAGTPAAAWPAPRASGGYANARTGTTGSYAAGRQYNAWTGNATRGYDRTVNGAAAARATWPAPATTTPTPASGPRLERVRTGAGRQHRRPHRRHDRRARRAHAHAGGDDHLQRQHRQDQYLEHRQRRQQPLCRQQRQRLCATTAAAGSSIPRAAGAPLRAITPGPTANRRRAARATWPRALAGFGGGGCSAATALAGAGASAAGSAAEASAGAGSGAVAVPPLTLWSILF